MSLLPLMPVSGLSPRVVVERHITARSLATSSSGGNALGEPQHLLVVVDDERDVAVDQRGVGPVRRRARPSRNCHAVLPGRGNLSVRRMARSAAVRTSWMSALTASGSLVSSAISSL